MVISFNLNKKKKIAETRDAGLIEFLEDVSSKKQEHLWVMLIRNSTRYPPVSWRKRF